MWPSLSIQSHSNFRTKKDRNTIGIICEEEGNTGSKNEKDQKVLNEQHIL